MDNCVEWPKGCTPLGYGYYLHNGKQSLAHRVIWSIVYGPIPFGYVLHHKCHNRKCVNINHLELMERTRHARLERSDGIVPVVTDDVVNAIDGPATVRRCNKGHEMTVDNTSKNKAGYTYCRQCHKDACKKVNDRNRMLRLTAP